MPQIVTNMPTNLSTIATQSGIIAPRKERGASLPPSALPRPPKNFKPSPRKIDYDRLSDSELKKRSETPPKIPNNQRNAYELKTSSLKRGETGKRSFSPAKNYIEMKETYEFAKPDFILKHKDYGAINKTETRFGAFKPTVVNEFSKPDHISTKNYQRLDDKKIITKNTAIESVTAASSSGNSSISIKRSLLPSARKNTVLSPTGHNNSPSKNSRDSVNSASSGSNNSNSRSSPIHAKTDSQISGITFQTHAKTPPKYTSLSSGDNKSFLPKTTSGLTTSKLYQPTQQLQQLQPPNNCLKLPNPKLIISQPANTASLPPKPVDTKSTRRGSSLSRGEVNRYRIQF